MRKITPACRRTRPLAAIGNPGPGRSRIVPSFDIFGRLKLFEKMQHKLIATPASFRNLAGCSVWHGRYSNKNGLAIIREIELNISWAFRLLFGLLCWALFSNGGFCRLQALPGMPDQQIGERK